MWVYQWKRCDPCSRKFARPWGQVPWIFERIRHTLVLPSALGLPVITQNEKKGDAVSAEQSLQERAEPQFGALSFHCPINARTVSTGIYTDEHSVARLRTIRLRIRCPHCGEEHAIKVGDTFVSATIIDHHRPSLSLVSSRR
jgi:hypothetical protein